LAAPLPRPPQPMSPILMAPLPAAWAPRAIDRLPATAAAEETFKNARRDGVNFAD